MRLKKFKITYQKNSKILTIILNANLLNELKNDKQYPQNILYIKEIKKNKWEFKRKKVSKINIINLFEEINIMLQAGLRLQETLDILIKQYSINTIEYEILETIILSLKQGVPIHISLNKYRYILGEFILSFIKLGEENGNMQDAINSLCIILIKDNNNKKQILQTLNYPILLLVTLSIAISIIFIYVIPKFEYMFGQLDASLPIITQILLFIKLLFFKYSYMVLSIIFLIVTSIVIGYKKSVKFKYNIDKILLLKIPYISKLLMTQQMYIFFLVLKVLIKSGYKLQEALISSKTIIINCFFVSKIENINNYLKQGKDISGSFNNINIFDTLTIRLLLAGEKTNNMNSIMEKLEIIYEQRLQNSIKKISSYLEPILVAIIGFVILFIMLAIFLPIWQMGTVLK